MDWNIIWKEKDLIRSKPSHDLWFIRDSWQTLCVISVTQQYLWIKEENLIHVFKIRTHVWIRLVPYNKMTPFYSLSCRDCIVYHLKGNITGSYKDQCRSIFMISCRYLWKWRNKSLFEEGFHRSDNLTGPIIHIVKEIVIIVRKGKCYVTRVRDQAYLIGLTRGQLDQAQL